MALPKDLSLGRYFNINIYMNDMPEVVEKCLASPLLIIQRSFYRFQLMKWKKLLVLYPVTFVRWQNGAAQIICF